MQSAKAVITVIGIDKIGIIAGISAILADNLVNIEDISQTTMQGYFMMSMLADISAMSAPFDELSEKLSEKGKEMGLEVRIQKDEIFKAMHSV
ncbi:MAG: ACT domain-containing protein [Oscillospiraceae bacterium]|nr:ACT domain-containing protein [Oscillospiraceae bacterium]